MQKKNRFCFILSYFFFNEIIKRLEKCATQMIILKKWCSYFMAEVRKNCKQNGSKKTLLKRLHLPKLSWNFE